MVKKIDIYVDELLGKKPEVLRALFLAKQMKTTPWDRSLKARG